MKHFRTGKRRMICYENAGKDFRNSYFLKGKGTTDEEQETGNNAGTGNNQGYLYLLPWIIGFLIFQLYPIAMSLYYSFTDYSFGAQYDFVGLANYLQIFTKDREVKNSLAVTFKFVFMSVPMKLISALIIAMLLNQALKGIGLFRTIYYLPSILGGSVAIAILWRHLFDLNGVVNVFLNRLGIKSIGF